MQALLKHLETVEQQLHNTSLFSAEQQTAIEQDFTQLCADLFSKNPLQAVHGEFSSRIEIPEVVQIGTLHKTLDAQNHLELPALIPFRDTQGLCFAINDNNKEQVHTLMQAMALQIIQQLPLHLVDCLFVDLKTLGLAFPYANSLSNKIKRETITTETALRNTLNELLDKQTLIINQYLTHRYKNLVDYNQQADLQERFKFLFIANFPRYFSREIINHLTRLVEIGSKTGLFLIYSYDEYDVDKAHTSAELNNLLTKSLYIYQDTQARWKIKNSASAAVFNNDNLNVMTASPSKDWQSYSATNSLQLNHYSHDELDRAINRINSQCEQQTQAIMADYTLEIPLGKNQKGEVHSFILGKDTGVHHAIIGGTAGMGKTNLLNLLIARGMAQYSADKLKFVLLDCGGVGFQEFEGLPAIEKFCSTKQPEIALEMIKWLPQEHERRVNLFTEAKVDSLAKYVQKTGKVLPRLLVIIDEFQRLFQQPKINDVNFVDRELVNILREYRKFGLHLILCTQSLGDGIRRALLDNIPLRIALGMNDTQSVSFLAPNNDEAKNLQLGQAIYNANKGDKSANCFLVVDKFDESVLPHDGE